MTEAVSRPPRTLWIGLTMFFALFAFAFGLWLLAAVRNFGQVPLPPLGPVADFTLTNQAGQVVTLAALSNHVWVADIVFTRCAGPCPRMTGQMRSVETLVPASSSTRFVTLTTDPDYDTPAVLTRYGQHFNADFSRWIFLTGSKAQIAGLASDSLKLSAVPVKPEDRLNDADLFIHTTIFVLVDKRGQLRASFETGGDSVDWTNSVLPKLLKSVRQLEDE